MSRVLKVPELEITDRSNIRLKYLLTFLSIGQCGIGFLALKESYVVAAVLLLFLSIFRASSFRFFKVLPWALLNILLYIFQTLSFEAYDVTIVQLLYLLLRLMVPAMYLCLIGREYYKFFVKVLYVYALISFVFWGIELIVPQLGSYLRTLAIWFSSRTGTLIVDYKNISLFLAYTFTTTSKYSTIARNAGPFWEPGAFAVYIAVALVLLFLHTRSIRNKYILVFSLAMLTTQSTAGYLTLFIFYIWAITSSRTRYKTLVLIFIVFASYGITISAPFMNRKISDVYYEESTRSLSGVTSGRIYSARKSINSLWQHPFIGRGISRRTAYEEDSEFYGTYGIIDIPARFGLIMGSVYFILLFLSLKIYARNHSLKGDNVFALAAFMTLVPVYFAQGVYLSVVNLLILQTVMVFGKSQPQPANSIMSITNDTGER